VRLERRQPHYAPCVVLTFGINFVASREVRQVVPFGLLFELPEFIFD
jgi:hypothetical protein